jgi:hypothetical protein
MNSSAFHSYLRDIVDRKSLLKLYQSFVGSNISGRYVFSNESERFSSRKVQVLGLLFARRKHIRQQIKDAGN